jgi:Big-like domain-containing protein/VWA domain-containing protein
MQILALVAAITFVSPQQGSQAIGVLPLEVTTNVAGVNRVEFYVDGAMVGVARQAPYRILHDFGTSLAGHDIMAKVYSNNFQTVDSARIATAAMTAGETVHVDLVEVPMRVRSSRPLRAEDIRIAENGIEQTIREVQSDRGPARFVFIIDRSLSMGGGKLTAALRAIDEESKLLRSDDRVEVVLFNHNVMPARAVARGERVESVLGGIRPSGGTSLRDAVSSIASHDRTYAIVITDGGDRNSLTTEEDSLRKISGTKLILDAIVLGDSSRFLDRAAKNTGGTVSRASTSAVQRELHGMILDINSRYTVSYQSHGNASGWRFIAVTARGRGIEILNARKGYFAE